MKGYLNDSKRNFNQSILPNDRSLREQVSIDFQISGLIVFSALERVDIK